MNNPELVQDLQNRFPTRLVDELLSLPGELQARESKLQAIKFKQAEGKRKIEQWELRELKKIAEEVDEANKKVYSNEILRKAELERRKEASQELQQLTNELFDTSIKEEVENIEIRYLDRRFKAMRTIAELLCQR